MSESPDRRRWLAADTPERIWLCALVLVGATLLAYRDSFRVPFLFDDIPSIVENPAIRESRLDVRGQPGGLTTSGRPVVALTLALNYLAHGLKPWGYHAVNLGIHLAACLLLFGLVRRTSLRSAQRTNARGEATRFAFLVAAGWSLHPLPTAAVTYIVQRAEALAAMCCLATLYAFVRAKDSMRPVGWRAGSVIMCGLGMASKETAAVIPLLVLMYDRTFVSGTYRAAWLSHRRYYVALAATWLILAGLVLATSGRGGTAGFGADVSGWHYALTQSRALVQYLALAAWPSPLVFDYGMETVERVTAVLPQIGLVGLLIGLAGYAHRRWPVAGFLVAGFLLLLAPSSSFVPIATQTIAEHRMYLPLALVIIGAGLFFRRLCGRRAGPGLALAAVLGLLCTPLRNRDYGSEAAIWADTAAKRPTNARAHNNLGQALYRLGRVDEALASYQRALALQPTYPETHYNIGVALGSRGDDAGAVQSYLAALRWAPAYVEAHNNLGSALVRLDRWPEALPHFERALELRPDFAEARGNLGNALLQAGRREEAIEQLRWVVTRLPENAEGLYNLGNAVAAGGDMAEALRLYERALQIRPAYPAALVNAGNALLALGRLEPALGSYLRAAELNPKLADAHYNAGAVLLELERWGEAIPCLEAALAQAPNHARAERALGFALGRTGRIEQALAHYERFLQAAPDDAEARAEYLQLRAARPGAPSR